jgi:hypothetical protein
MHELFTTNHDVANLAAVASLEARFSQTVIHLVGTRLAF